MPQRRLAGQRGMHAAAGGGCWQHACAGACLLIQQDTAAPRTADARATHEHTSRANSTTLPRYSITPAHLEPQLGGRLQQHARLLRLSPVLEPQRNLGVGVVAAQAQHAADAWAGTRHLVELAGRVEGCVLDVLSLGVLHVQGALAGVGEDDLGAGHAQLEHGVELTWGGRQGRLGQGKG
jgi:hypothetical protein